MAPDAFKVPGRSRGGLQITIQFDPPSSISISVKWCYATPADWVAWSIFMAPRLNTIKLCQHTNGSLIKKKCLSQVARFPYGRMELVVESERSIQSRDAAPSRRQIPPCVNSMFSGFCGREIDRGLLQTSITWGDLLPRQAARSLIQKSHLALRIPAAAELLFCQEYRVDKQGDFEVFLVSGGNL